MSPNLFIIIAGLSYVMEGMRTHLPVLWHFRAISESEILTPPEASGAFLVGPNDTNRPSWMYLNQDPLISSHLGPSYGQKYLIYGLFRPILTPQGPPMAISVGPNVTNRPSWMCPTQIRLLIQPFEPFGVTRAAYGQPYPTYGILGSSEPFLALGHNFLKHSHPFRA